MAAARRSPARAGADAAEPPGLLLCSPNSGALTSLGGAAGAGAEGAEFRNSSPACGRAEPTRRRRSRVRLLRRATDHGGARQSLAARRPSRRAAAAAASWRSAPISRSADHAPARCPARRAHRDRRRGARVRHQQLPGRRRTSYDDYFESMGRSRWRHQSTRRRQQLSDLLTTTGVTLDELESRLAGLAEQQAQVVDDRAVS